MGVRDLDVQALESYLRGHLAGFRGPLVVRQFRGGQSNPTYMLETPERRFVLRRRPAGVPEHAWRLRPGTLAGLAGEDLARLGIPDEASYVRSYFDRMGGRPEDLTPFLAFAAFRLAAILIGVAKRGEDGTATNSAARDFGIAAREVAELGADIIKGRS